LVLAGSADVRADSRTAALLQRQEGSAFRKHQKRTVKTAEGAFLRGQGHHKETTVPRPEETARGNKGLGIDQRSPVFQRGRLVVGICASGEHAPGGVDPQDKRQRCDQRQLRLGQRGSPQHTGRGMDLHPKTMIFISNHLTSQPHCTHSALFRLPA
jgi:hypothetical protein